MKMLHIGVCYHIWEMGQFYMTNQSKKDAYLYKKNFAAYCSILLHIYYIQIFSLKILYYIKFAASRLKRSTTYRTMENECRRDQQNPTKTFLWEDVIAFRMGAKTLNRVEKINIVLPSEMGLP